MSDSWWEEEGCVGLAPIGYAPIPYFLAGVVATVGLLYVGWNLYRTDNTIQRGMKNIDVILPVYTTPVWYVLVVGVLVGITNMLGILSSELYSSVIKWFLYRIVSEGLAIFLMHNGVGQRALRNACIFGGSWAIISSVVPLFIYYHYNYDAYVITTIAALGVTLLFYLVLWLLPQRFLHRRPAIVNYAFWNIITLSMFVAVMAMLIDLDYSMASCSIEIILSVGWMLQPFILLQAIRQDSLFWQGLYSHPRYAYSVAQIFGFGSWGGDLLGKSTAQSPDLNEPLLGIWDIGRDTIDIVAASINLLEKKVVPIIPFGFIQIDNSRYSSGGTARVYRGKFGKKDVAVKFLFCLELTPERVEEFCAEATLLNSLQHDNVVSCMGVSVMPPALCLVTEFCQYGSLYDFLHKTDMIINEACDGNMSNSAASGDSDSRHYLLKGRDRVGSASSTISNVTPWASDSGTDNTSLRDSISTTRESEDGTSSRGSSFGGSYNANNSKHIRALLVDLPEIVEGSEHSFDQSSMASTATRVSAATNNPNGMLISDTTTPMHKHGGHGGHGGRTGAFGLGPYGRTEGPESGNMQSQASAESEDPSVDMATALARAVHASKDSPLRPDTNAAALAAASRAGSDGGLNSQRESGNTGAGSSFGYSHNIRRRLDSAEYYIEREASNSLITSRPRARTRTGSGGRGDGESVYSGGAESNATTFLTQSLLSESNMHGSGYPTPGTFGKMPDNSTSGTGGEGRKKANVALKKMSCVLKECDNLGQSLGPSWRDFWKQSKEEIRFSADSRRSSDMSIPNRASMNSSTNTYHSANTQPSDAQMSYLSTDSGVGLGFDEEGGEDDGGEESNGNDIESNQLGKLKRSHSTGSSSSEASKKNKAIAMRPTSPVLSGDGSKGGSPDSGSNSAGKSSDSFRPSILGSLQINVPARIRLKSGASLDATATNVGAFLAGNQGFSPPTTSKDRSAARTSSAGSGGQQMGTGPSVNNAYYNNNSNYVKPKVPVLVLPLSLRIRMAKDCCSGVAYLHANGFMHCDIKSLNFLVDSDLNVKLSDLGEARSSVQASQQERLFPSNINWSAPEVLSEQQIITSAADIWSLAMVIVEMLTGHVPFDTPEWRAMRMDEFLECLHDGKRPYLPVSISDQFPWLTRLISKAWQFEPEKRCDSIYMLNTFVDKLDSSFGYQTQGDTRNL